MATFEFFRWRSGSQSIVSIPAMGLELEGKLPKDKGDGELAIIETINAPNSGPLVHRHREAEIFRVLAGRYLYAVDVS